MILIRQGDRAWVDTGVPGVQRCRVWSGDGTDGLADGGYLAKFDAGASFPKHAHQGWEQIMVLEGAIRFNDVEMRKGDVLQVQGDDEHGAVALEDTLLLVSHHGSIEILE